MSQMLAEIRRIVDEDVSNRVTQYDVLFEAITNSIHANATTINCLLASVANTQLDFTGNETPEKRVDSITIIDNGDGMTDENYRSFCKYRTTFKQQIGGKGVGRFVFLKLYDKVRVRSEIKKLKVERSFNFEIEFDTENIVGVEKKVKQNLTEISLTNLNHNYYDSDRHVDRRIELNLAAIRDKIFLNLLPILFFYKKQSIQILVEITDTAANGKVTIEADDIPDFKSTKFSVQDKAGAKHQFTLNYIINRVNGSLSSHYCANSRTVCEFSEKDLKITLPDGYSGFFLLEGPYLDNHVNNSRNDFDIWPVKTDMFSLLSWEMINEELKTAISKLIKKAIPETISINKAKLEEIQTERPYLTQYIEDEDIDIAGFLDKRHIIEKAKRKFDSAKEKLLGSAGKTSYSDDELREAIEITQNELISYINDRVQVIERLKILIDKRERVESVIHDLFMKKHTDSVYFNVGVNNLWLLDDRFTTYSYAASDKKIEDVLSSIGELPESESGNDKPDLSIFFSNNPSKPGKLKSVLIELKPFEYASKSSRKKFQGIQQLIDYVKAFKEKEKIEEIFAFLITDIDKQLGERLTDDSYTPLFSIEAPIYHRFYPNAGISIYVVSARTLILDAEARNKVFLDIIRKQSRLNIILNKKH